MTDRRELEALARTIVDSNLYMTLATADAGGRPWASPVYYAAAGYGELLWVSSPETTHSRNIAARPEVGIVIFDSTVPINTGRGVYMSAVAERLAEADVERGMEIFSARSQAHGGDAWSPADVRPPAELRLFRATVTEHSLHRPQHPRTPVTLE